MNFAIQPKKCEPMPSCPEPSKGPSYPEICLRDEQFEQFKELLGGDLKLGQMLTLNNPKFKIKGLREDQYGKAIDLCLIECDGASKDGEAGESEEDESDGEDKPLKEKLKKPAPKKPLKERLSKSQYPSASED